MERWNTVLGNPHSSLQADTAESVAEVQLLAEGCEPIRNRTVVEWVVLEVIVSELL